MAVIRRNPKLSALTGSLFLILIVGLVLWTRTPAHAQGTYPPLDPGTAGQIGQLRQAAGLNDDGLASLNLPADPLETLLAGVRSWHQQHGAEWLAAFTAVADQQGRIRALETDQGLGHDQRAALADARTQLALLQTAYETQLTAVRTAVLSGLSDDQQHLFDRMRTRTNVPMPYRALDLTPDQDASLAQAAALYHQRLATTPPEQRPALADGYAQQIATLIGPNNVRALNTISDYLGTASQRLVTTLQLVFPSQPEG